ncbi:hypothetical protein AB5I41_13470 [Sphingomonas sp. MMS24-JH45]
MLYRVDPQPDPSQVASARAALARARAAIASSEALTRRYGELVRLNAIARQEYDKFHHHRTGALTSPRSRPRCAPRRSISPAPPTARPSRAASDDRRRPPVPSRRRRPSRWPRSRNSIRCTSTSPRRADALACASS